MVSNPRNRSKVVPKESLFVWHAELSTDAEWCRYELIRTVRKLELVAAALTAASRMRDVEQALLRLESAVEDYYVRLYWLRERSEHLWRILHSGPRNDRSDDLRRARRALRAAISDDDIKTRHLLTHGTCLELIIDPNDPHRANEVLDEIPRTSTRGAAIHRAIAGGITWMATDYRRRIETACRAAEAFVDLGRSNVP